MERIASNKAGAKTPAGSEDNMTINKSIAVSLTTEEMAFIKWLADRDKVSVARELRQIFYTELGELIDLYDEERKQESEGKQ